MTEFPHVPVVVHQDHGTSPAVCQRSIQLGFSSVMMDGSLGDDGKTPMDYDYNAGVTRQVVDMAHACGVSVEGELGCLGSLETGEAGEEDGIGAAGKLSHDQLLTDPGRGGPICSRYRSRCVGHCLRHQPRSLQVHASPHRRHSGHGSDQGDSQSHSRHASGDATARRRYPKIGWR